MLSSSPLTQAGGHGHEQRRGVIVSCQISVYGHQQWTSSDTTPEFTLCQPGPSRFDNCLLTDPGWGCRQSALILRSCFTSTPTYCRFAKRPVDDVRATFDVPQAGKLHGYEATIESKARSHCKATPGWLSVTLGTAMCNST